MTYIIVFSICLALCLESIGMVESKTISEIRVGRHTLKSVPLSLTSVTLLSFIDIDFVLTKGITLSG